MFPLFKKQFFLLCKSDDESFYSYSYWHFGNVRGVFAVCANRYKYMHCRTRKQFDFNWLSLNWISEFRLRTVVVAVVGVELFWEWLNLCSVSTSYSYTNASICVYQLMYNFWIRIVVIFNMFFNVLIAYSNLYCILKYCTAIAQVFR